MEQMPYFVEHTDPKLREFYLFTSEGEPNPYGTHLCFLMERETLHLGEYRGESGVQVRSKYVRGLISMEDFPVEEMFGDPGMMERFLFTIKLILRNT